MEPHGGLLGVLGDQAGKLLDLPLFVSCSTPRQSSSRQQRSHWRRCGLFVKSAAVRSSIPPRKLITIQRTPRVRKDWPRIWSTLPPTLSCGVRLVTRFKFGELGLHGRVSPGEL